MKPVTILKRTRKLLDKPEHWIKGHFATNAHGEVVSAFSRSARAFCLRGAFQRVSPDLDDRNAATNYLRTRLGPISPIVWNDAPYRTHRQVLRVLDRAIALAEKEAQS